MSATLSSTTEREPEGRKVFVSHSSEDKPVVEKLVRDLEQMGLDVWFDRESIQVSESIPQRINDGLRDADYVVVALSKNSVNSAWVKMELDAALIAEAAGESVVIVPIRLDDCEVDPLLRPRLYADLRDYDAALESLRELFSIESPPKAPTVAQLKDDTCEGKLSRIGLGDLREKLCNLGRAELKLLWFDVFGEDMEDHYPNCNLGECAMHLVLRCKREQRLDLLYKTICRSEKRRRAILGSGSDPT